MINRFLFFLAIISVSGICLAQPESQNQHPFQPGEKLSYIASYNMKGLMTELAGIDMEVFNVPDKKKPIYRLKLTANTLTSWDNYVKVRHAYQTYVDAATMKPLIMAQDSDVKGQTTKAKYSFKHKSGIVIIKASENEIEKAAKTIKLKENSFDLVSMIYFARTLDYSKYKNGKSIKTNTIALERSIPVTIKYLGKESLNVEGMGTKTCYKIALVLEQKLVVEPDVTFMWISADNNKVPVQISTIFKEGKALVKLSKYEGLKH